MTKRGNVIIKAIKADYPRDHELSAAIIIADYFQTDVLFIRPSCQKTPDFLVDNIRWELKSQIQHLLIIKKSGDVIVFF